MMAVPHIFAFSPESCSIHLTSVFASFCWAGSLMEPTNADTLAAVALVLFSAMAAPGNQVPKRLTRLGETRLLLFPNCLAVPQPGAAARSMAPPSLRAA